MKTMNNLHQNNTLAFGEQKSVNAVNPATISRLYNTTFNKANNNGTMINKNFAKNHSLAINNRFSITSMKNTKLTLIVRTINNTPALNVLNLSPITITQDTFNHAFEQQHNQLTFINSPINTMQKTITNFPNTKIESKTNFINNQTT